MIKNEYYYIESKDNQIPQVIEKTIKETVVVNQPSIKEFSNNEMALSNQNNFNIQGDKNGKKDINLRGKKKI